MRRCLLPIVKVVFFIVNLSRLCLWRVANELCDQLSKLGMCCTTPAVNATTQKSAWIDHQAILSQITLFTADSALRRKRQVAFQLCVTYPPNLRRYGLPPSSGISPLLLVPGHEII